jgi:polysaccharide export outer membrane protein
VSYVSEIALARRCRSTLCKTAVILVGAAIVSGCTVLPQQGPSTRAISNDAGSLVDSGVIKVVAVTDEVARRLVATQRNPKFSEQLGDGTPAGSVVGPGDTLDISIWEAPPAALFGTAVAGDLPVRSTSVSSIGRNSMLPEQAVGLDGTIRVPFAGSVVAAGRTPQQIAQEIQRRLVGKAHDPQVLVRLARHATTEVTVVGDVANSVRMPLTAKGERLLDALASAGGAKQPVGKMTIQVTRGALVEAMPLDAVIKDPKQNIRLQSDDVVTFLFQPYSFTVLGAARANQEISFEGTGLTLSQALGRMGGLDDQRANPKGVFIFRFEQPSLFSVDGKIQPATTVDGRVPVIYQINMRDPKTLFIAQSFPIRDKDVVYVSNAPLADFSKFLQAVSQIVYPIATIQNSNIF